MTLKQLLTAAQVPAVETLGDAQLTGIQADSRRCGPGSLFVCMPETTRPSEPFIASATANGAVAAIVYSKEGMELARQAGIAAALVPHRDYHFPAEIARICDAFFQHPTRDLKVIGITGTNGKTTTAFIVRDLLKELGHKVGYLGTLGFELPDEKIDLENTTPFAVDLYNLIAKGRQSGIDSLAMEVSSHSLAQHRVDGLEFDVTVLTNISQDHLDFHGSMDSYAAAKHRLFTRESTKRMVAAFNVDDEHGRRWAEEQNGSTITFATDSSDADLTVEPVEVALDHLTLNLKYGEEVQVRVPLGGSYNVQNTLSAVASVLALGYKLDEIASVLPKVHPVPGRFEPVPNEKGIGILVDYAHTPDALEKLLESVRGVAKGRIISVFGCGGDRDRTKRPLMALAASQLSDLTVVTSDNPRTEDPQAILDEVLTGVVSGSDAVAILDRPEAISYAVRAANPGDVVVIAGKGHENYQIIGRTKHPMDDRELAAAALEAR